MIEVLHRIYRSLQMLRRPIGGDDGAIWYLHRDLTSEWEGPFEAVEVAFLIYTGRAGPRDVVAHGGTQEMYVIEEAKFLARWLRGGEDRELRLLRGLIRALRARSRGRGAAVPASVARWMTTTLTAEQQRAFRVLDAHPLTSPEELRRRHRALALENHPDRGGDLLRMKEINWAIGVALDAAF